MAVPQAFYANFARFLARRGYTTWTFDYRGIGDSLSGPRRKLKADLDDWLRKDYDALLRMIAAAARTIRCSSSATASAARWRRCLPSRERLAGLVNIAVGSGATRHLTPRLKRSAPLLWHVLAPALCPLFGYFPGASIGVVGDLPTGALYQWRRWCLTPDYLLSGEPGAREAYASADYPVLALTFADDELLLEEGSRLLHGAYRRRAVDFRLVEPAQHGLARIGHFGFFKPPSEAALWPLVAEWLDHSPGTVCQATAAILRHHTAFGSLAARSRWRWPIFVSLVEFVVVVLGSRSSAAGRSASGGSGLRSSQVSRAAYKSSGSTGLATKSFIPASRQARRFSSNTFAVSARIGTFTIASAGREWRAWLRGHPCAASGYPSGSGDSGRTRPCRSLPWPSMAMSGIHAGAIQQFERDFAIDHVVFDQQQACAPPC
jgi:predicted alpha/beta hydrolase